MLFDLNKVCGILIGKRKHIANSEYGCAIVLAELVKKMMLYEYVPNRLDVNFGDYKNWGNTYKKVSKEDVESLLNGTGISLVNFRNEFSIDKGANELTLWLEYN